ncbi:MAG: DUF1640 domain-containing protein [Nitrospirae bacterium]|nr:DUF1640 domain-containing protein [Nitrospirota bacterium]
MGEDGVDAPLAVFSEVSLNTRNDSAAKSEIKDMATKSDLKDLATALRQDMATKTDIKDMAAKEDIANLKTEIEKSKTDTIKWMLAFAATQVGILIAAMGLMFKFFTK